MKIKFNAKRVIAFSMIPVIIVLLFVWDNFIDPPAFWRTERQADKKAILKYVENKYPNAIGKGGKFPFQQIAGPHPFSVMYFELDGIDFHIGAEYGSVVDDGYSKARANAQIDNIIYDGFLNPRNITASTYYHFSDSTDTYPYTGSLRVDITVSDQGSTPQEIGWLYDFYEYWATEGDFLRNYQVNIYVDESETQKCFIRYNKDSVFSNEDDFYSAFKSI